MVCMTVDVSAIRPAISRSEQPRGLEELFREHGATVARWAARLGAGAGVDPDDVVQDVFLVVQRRLPQYQWDRGGEVTTWLYRITERVVRKRRSRESWLRRWLAPVALSNEPAYGGPSPLQQLETRRSAATFDALLQKLDDKYRSVLVLYEVEQLTGDEIARLMGVPPATVRVRLHRARQQFDKHLRRLHEQAAKERR